MTGVDNSSFFLRRKLCYLGQFRLLSVFLLGVNANCFSWTAMNIDFRT